jgi:hypothetical protein
VRLATDADRLRDFLRHLGQASREQVSAAELERLLAAVEPQLYRFPAVDGGRLRQAVERLRRE